MQELGKDPKKGGIENVSKIVRKLQEDRLIEIYVGAIEANSKPYLVQQTVLEDASDYFIRALNKNTFREGQEGRLHFPEDDSLPWKVFLTWVTKYRLPNPLYGDRLLCSCWSLGDKYAVPEFQDDIMLELIKGFEDNTPSDSVIRFALRNSTLGSKLRKLIVEEVAYQVIVENTGSGGLGVMTDALSAAVDGQEILTELDQPCARVTADSHVFSRRTKKEKGGTGRADWREYLIGEGPVKHWIYDC